MKVHRSGTHTYALLEVSPGAYAEIRAKLEAAGYAHAFHQDDNQEVIDLHGLALVAATPLDVPAAPALSAEHELAAEAIRLRDKQIGAIRRACELQLEAALGYASGSIASWRVMLAKVHETILQREEAREQIVVLRRAREHQLQHALGYAEGSLSWPEMLGMIARDARHFGRIPLVGDVDGPDQTDPATKFGELARQTTLPVEGPQKHAPPINVPVRRNFATPTTPHLEDMRWSDGPSSVLLEIAEAARKLRAAQLAVARAEGAEATAAAFQESESQARRLDAALGSAVEDGGPARLPADMEERAVARAVADGVIPATPRGWLGDFIARATRALEERPDLTEDEYMRSCLTLEARGYAALSPGGWLISFMDDAARAVFAQPELTYAEYMRARLKRDPADLEDASVQAELHTIYRAIEDNDLTGARTLFAAIQERLGADDPEVTRARWILDTEDKARRAAEPTVTSERLSDPLVAAIADGRTGYHIEPQDAIRHATALAAEVRDRRSRTHHRRLRSGSSLGSLDAAERAELIDLRRFREGVFALHGEVVAGAADGSPIDDASDVSKFTVGIESLLWTEPGSGHPRPRATQQGAATPGQGASSAAGNVAEPQPSPGSVTDADVIALCGDDAAKWARAFVTMLRFNGGKVSLDEGMMTGWFANAIESRPKAPSLGRRDLELHGDRWVNSSSTTRSHVHIRGVYGDCGENEGVLSVTAVLDATANHPTGTLIIVGSPQASPLIDGYIPDLGGFSCGPEGAEQLIDVLQDAVRSVRQGLLASAFSPKSDHHQ